MIGLYFDHHVPAAVVDGLRRRGVDVLTAFEDGYHEKPDDELLTRATALDRILFSQDAGRSTQAHPVRRAISRRRLHPSAGRHYQSNDRWLASVGGSYVYRRLRANRRISSKVTIHRLPGYSCRRRRRRAVQEPASATWKRRAHSPLEYCRVRPRLMVDILHTNKNPSEPYWSICA